MSGALRLWTSGTLRLSRPTAGRGEIRTLAALAAVALVGWYLLSPSGIEPPEAAAPAPAGVQDGGPAAGAGAGAGEAGAEGESARGDLARAIIEELRGQGRIDLDQVYERAERFRSIGLQADAFLLYFFAARQGHAPSALALGRMYDPKSFTREASILEGPDAAQAHKWYLAAARAGDAAAKRHLADLRARVERSASQGEDDARRLMLQWR
jgi:TPR repeat protein